MPENLLFLTGKLAESSLHKVLAAMQPATFNHQIKQIGVSVAALMTPELIARRLPDACGADRILLPGLCKGDLRPLMQKYGVAVERGPNDLKDLPQYFGHDCREPDLSMCSTRIFAEIVDATELTVEEVVARAKCFRTQGADVIDLGCLPNTPFEHLEDCINALHELDLQVSVDSLDSNELLRAGLAGADYLLSLTEKNLWIVDQVKSTPVIIPARPRSLPSLYRAIEIMQRKDRAFIADPILDPIPFGLTASIIRYHRLRKKYPEIQIMMGVGNLTELTDADTTGVNALLFGLAAEMTINVVLTTTVSPHTRNAIREADMARRIMHASQRDQRLPRDYSDALLGLHDRRPFPYSQAEIAELAAQVKDPNFRIQVADNGINIYNRQGVHFDRDPFRLYPLLNIDDDASHAFYLGVELARAQIAWQLGKRYIQDEELKWGCNTVKTDPRGHMEHRESSLRRKRVKTK